MTIDLLILSTGRLSKISVATKKQYTASKYGVEIKLQFILNEINIKKKLSQVENNIYIPVGFCAVVDTGNKES